MKSNFNVKYRLKRDSMDLVAFTSPSYPCMYVPAEKVVENVLTKYFFYNFCFKTARKLNEGNIKRLQKYQVSEKQVFFLVSSVIFT